jgi:hypothetical protein
MRAGILISVAMWAMLAIAILTIGGCAGWSSVKAGVANNGALVADEALGAAEWGVCDAATIGAWKRRYGNDSGKVEGWRALCGTQIRETPQE